MKTKTFSVPVILGFLGLAFTVQIFSVHAAGHIECKTAFGEKSFIIDDNRISFQKEDESGVSRSISSVSSESVRTHKQNLGFNKTLYLNGNKHRIHIENTNEFS